MTDTTILLGRVGSHAYGLAHEASDEDFLGVFVAPTSEIAGLHWSTARETQSQSSPGNESNDSTLHEVGKYMRLALKSNPTVTELLWLDDYIYEQPAGSALLTIRESFLSKKYVTDAYRGYAHQQLQKFITTGEWKPKHARHCLRLIHQGLGALKTGVVQVRVEDPQIYWDLAEMAPDDVVELLKRELEKFDETFSSPLRELPDDSAASGLLYTMRRAFI